jgi:hypothetical protein
MRGKKERAQLDRIVQITQQEETLINLEFIALI